MCCYGVSSIRLCTRFSSTESHSFGIARHSPVSSPLAMTHGPHRRSLFVLIERALHARTIRAFSHHECIESIDYINSPSELSGYFLVSLWFLSGCFAVAFYRRRRRRKNNKSLAMHPTTCTQVPETKRASCSPQSAEQETR